MEPQPQLQPVAPRPQLQYAEPAARPLELKPGRAPLDLRPRPSARPQLDLKYGPASPAEAAAQRANPLGNPLNVVQPVVNNPLGYAPGKGLIGIGSTLLDRATDAETFGVPTTPIVGLNLPALPNPYGFSPDAIEPGPVTTEHIPDTFTGGQTPGARYRVTIQYQSVFTNGQVNPNPTQFTVGGASGFAAPIIKAQGAVPPAWQSINLTAGSPASETQVRSGNCSQGCYRNIKIVSTAWVSGTPDAGIDPPPLQQGQRAPNRARDPYKQPALLTDPYPAPGTREQTPFLPIPTFRFPVLPAEAPQFIPYEPPSEVEIPEIQPVRPGILAPPAKFPAPVTVPQLPGDLENPDLDSPTRKLKPPFLPARPGTTPPEIIPPTKTPPIIVFIPPLRRDDCCADEAIERESQRIRDKLDDLLERGNNECKDLCEPAILTATECQEIDGTLSPVSVYRTVTTLSAALELLAAEVADIKQLLNPCSTAGGVNVAPILLSSGTMTDAETVSYVPVSPDVREVELIVTGQIPTTLRLYDTTQSGEQQGKFGSICVAYPGVTGGHAPDAFHQWAWTRRTLLFLGEPNRENRKVRIFLRAGLSWVLYDTGVRT